MPRFSPAIALPALLLLAPPPAVTGPEPLARAYAYRTWSTSSGLPPGVITDLAFDDQGLLHLATSAGLIRFDGQSFSITGVAELPAIRSNYVTSVAPDPRGGTWIGTPEGALLRIDRGRILDSLRAFDGVELTPEHILVRPRGEVWVAGGDRVRRLLDGTWSEVTLDGRPVVAVRALHADRVGAVWIGSEFGLFRFTDGRLREIPLPAWVMSGLAMRAPTGIHAIAEDREGRIWLATPDDLLVWEPSGRLLRVPKPAGTPGVQRTIAFDPFGQLWLGGTWGVVALRPVWSADGVALQTVYRDQAELSGSLVSKLAVDASGAVVLATSGRGLRTYAPLPFSRITVADGLPMASVHHVLGDGPDAMWIATTCFGVTRLDSTGVRVFDRPGELGLGTDSCIRSLARDAEGALWVGQRDRLSRVLPSGRTQVWQFDTTGARPSAFALLPVGRELWFALRPGGLRRITADGRLEVPPQARALTPEAIWSLARDSSGALWVGQIGEVTRFGPEGPRVFGSADGVPPGPIRVLHAEADGTLWMGSYGGGLARIRDGVVRRLSSADGLFDDAISALLPDGRGRYWLLGNAGVYVVRRARLDSAIGGASRGLDGVLYGAADGIPEGNGGYPAAWRQPDGRLYFASVNGATVFSGDATTSAGVVPVPHFTAVQSAEGTVVPGDTVALAPGTRTAVVRFTAASVAAAERLEFRYRVRGRAGPWIELGGRRELALRELRPGRVTLDLQVRDGDGIWVESPAHLTLAVPPTWWQTWWARAVLAALVVGGLVAILRLRVRAVEQANRLLRHEMAERERAELRAKQHLTELAHVSRVATAGELASSLAHELNQPLSAIAGNADAARAMLLRGTGTPEELQETLADIAEESRRAAGVIRTLRQFLRRGDGESERVDLSLAVREALPLVQHVLLKHRIELVLDDRGAPPVAGNRIALQQVVVNLVVNAAEAMDASIAPERRVWLRVGHGARGARLTVADTGTGVGSAQRRTIFEAFNTTKPGGIGMGLAICRSIVEAHGGSIDVRRAPWGGAVFSVVLPAAAEPAGRPR
jgi:signal transduction histidine kinase/ligand-binding sensor domain-containing protein